MLAMTNRDEEYFFSAAVRAENPEQLVRARGWDVSRHHTDGAPGLRLPSDLRRIAGDEDRGLYRSAMARQWWILDYKENQSEWWGHQVYIEVNDHPPFRRAKNNKEALAEFEAMASGGVE